MTEFTEEEKRRLLESAGWMRLDVTNSVVKKGKLWKPPTRRDEWPVTTPDPSTDAETVLALLEQLSKDYEVSVIHDTEVNVCCLSTTREKFGACTEGETLGEAACKAMLFFLDEDQTPNTE